MASEETSDPVQRLKWRTYGLIHSPKWLHARDLYLSSAQPGAQYLRRLPRWDTEHQARSARWAAGLESRRHRSRVQETWDPYKRALHTGFGVWVGKGSSRKSVGAGGWDPGGWSVQDRQETAQTLNAPGPQAAGVGNPISAQEGVPRYCL